MPAVIIRQSHSAGKHMGSFMSAAVKGIETFPYVWELVV